MTVSHKQTADLALVEPGLKGSNRDLGDLIGWDFVKLNFPMQVLNAVLTKFAPLAIEAILIVEI